MLALVFLVTVLSCWCNVVYKAQECPSLHCWFRDRPRKNPVNFLWVCFYPLSTYVVTQEINLGTKQGLVCAPHVLISATQRWSARGFFWSALIRIRNPPSPTILAGKQLSNGPTQSYSALNHWNQFSCWVMLIRTEWHWTELNFTQVLQLLLY